MPFDEIVSLLVSVEHNQQSKFQARKFRVVESTVVHFQLHAIVEVFKGLLDRSGGLRFNLNHVFDHIKPHL